MSSIPLQTFEGFLKQHAYESLLPLEQELFEILFPLFEGDDSAAKSGQILGVQLKQLGLSDLITAVPPEPRTRRFAGVNFPRRKYYSVAVDMEGNDNQTLAHELRAYRDPIKLGMVEVIDLSRACRIGGDADHVDLSPEHSIAVLIHNLDLIPQRLRSLPFRRLLTYKDRPLYLYRFPYKVVRRTINGVIDLRFPHVQEWFYNTFK